MLDVRFNIANLLKCIAPVELAGSEAPLQMPSLYLSQTMNAPAVKMNKRDFLTEFTIQIDIYAETASRSLEIALEVDRIMQCEGWTRQNGLPMGLQRYVLTYTGLVSEKYHIYEKE